MELATVALLFAGGGTALGADRQAGPQPVAALVDVFERELERLLRRDRVPGAAAAILHRGEVVWEHSAGLADGAMRVAVGDDTAFQVASLSKPITALGVLLLVQDGRLDLDRPVWDYIGSWRLPAAAHDASGVTARLLLSHRAGVGVHGYPGYPPDAELPSLLESLEGASGEGVAVELVSAPGSRVLYSSGGYSVLQLLVEEITGEPFAVFMQRRVLRPLGMTRSSFEGGSGALASGHGWWGGRLPAYRFREQAASGLFATAGDLARFLALFSSPAAQAAVGVEPATLEAMLQPPSGGGFALGFAVEPAADPDRLVVSHNGANRGFRAILAAAPDRGDGIVVLTNSDRGLAMTNDLYCEWGAWTSEIELASCWAERKRRGTLLAVAGLIGLGLLMDGAAFARRQWLARRARRPSWAPAERHGWSSWIRLVVSIVLLAGWWLFWYTDQYALRREGIEHFVLASSLPPTFFWLTVVLTCWCLLGITRWIVVVRQGRSPGRGAGPAKSLPRGAAR